MFTAIAMVAFSGVSMAGTKVVEIEKKESKVRILPTSPQTCRLLASTVYNHSRNEECKSHEEALHDSNTFYLGCMTLNVID